MRPAPCGSTLGVNDGIEQNPRSRFCSQMSRTLHFLPRPNSLHCTVTSAGDLIVQI